MNNENENNGNEYKEDARIVLDANDFDKEVWKDILLKNIKWLRGNTSTDKTHYNLQGIYIDKDEGMAVASDGYVIAAWKPTNSEELNPLPNGLWRVSSIDTKFISLSRIEGNYPIKYMYDILNKEHGIETEAGIKVIDVCFNPTLLHHICNGFDKVKMIVCQCAHLLEMDNEHFGVLMGMHCSNDTINSAEIRDPQTNEPKTETVEGK